jgi:hypothetical protein
MGATDARSTSSYRTTYIRQAFSPWTVLNCLLASHCLTMSLPVPSFGLLRLASPRDILRIGVVAAAGFRYSPVFEWERPYHEKYPEDTLLSYRQEFASRIKSPKHVVLVAVDKYESDEGEKSKAIIPPNNGAEISAEGDEVVVGVAFWELQPGSKRIGTFQNETGTNYARIEVGISNT